MPSRTHHAPARGLRGSSETRHRGGSSRISETQAPGAQGGACREVPRGDGGGGGVVRKELMRIFKDDGKALPRIRVTGAESLQGGSGWSLCHPRPKRQKGPEERTGAPYPLCEGSGWYFRERPRGRHGLGASCDIFFVLSAPPNVALHTQRGSPLPKQGSKFGAQVAADSRGHL